MVHRPPVDVVTKATSAVEMMGSLGLVAELLFLTILKSDGSVVKLETLALRIQLS